MRRNPRWASAIPAAVQRRRMSPVRQRLTLRWVVRTPSNMLSIGFVEQSVRRSVPVTPSRVRVSGRSAFISVHDPG